MSTQGAYTFRRDAVHLVHQVVEDLEAQVAHTDLVHIGESQGHAHFGVLFDDAAEFPARVAVRPLHRRQHIYR